MDNTQLATVMASGEMPSIYLSGVLLDNKVLKKQEIDALIKVIDDKFLQLSPDPSELIIKGSNPRLLIESLLGDTSSAIEVFDTHSHHLVADISWSRLNQGLSFSVFDKTTGTLKGHMELKPNGTLYVDNKPIAYEEDIRGLQSSLLKFIDTKADKSSLPTVFSGESVPSDTLGKDYDRYHQFATGSVISSDIIQANTPSLDSFGVYFLLYSTIYGSPPQGNIETITVGSSNRMITINFTDNATLSTEGLTLYIKHSGQNEVEVPLILESNHAGGYEGSYSSTYDNVIADIVAIQTTFRIENKQGQTNDKEIDYEKHNGVWMVDDFLTADEVNDLIREYMYVVRMNLQHDKDPSRNECLIAFKTLPNFDWAKDDAFYIRDTGGSNMVSVTYLSDGGTSEATAGQFFFAAMNMAT